jgi:hypothetical protein
LVDTIGQFAIRRRLKETPESLSDSGDVVNRNWARALLRPFPPVLPTIMAHVTPISTQLLAVTHNPAAIFAEFLPVSGHFTRVAGPAVAPQFAAILPKFSPVTVEFPTVPA